MQIKGTTFKIKGMNKDLSYSAFNPEFSWDNHNIRLTARENNDLMSITNEKGNLLLLLNDVSPIFILKHSYTSEIINYIFEKKYVSYTYNIIFKNYILEQSDVPVFVGHTYSYQFTNYINEIQLI